MVAIVSVLSAFAVLAFAIGLIGIECVRARPRIVAALRRDVRLGVAVAPVPRRVIRTPRQAFVQPLALRAAA